MKNLTLLYEGKAKKVYALPCEDQVLVSYKDDATAFNGLKKGTIRQKGVINNAISNHLFQLLEKHDIPTHFIKAESERETIVKKVDIIPLEVIIRNIAAGSFSKRYGIAEGTGLKQPTIEFSYKNDMLGDPLINSSIAVSLSLATSDEIATVKEYSKKINSVLQTYLASIHIQLIDFKLEFGRFHNTIILADEISPDTCRLWDMTTGDHLDKDRFRRDLGNIEDAYHEVYRRMKL